MKRLTKMLETDAFPSIAGTAEAPVEADTGTISSYDTLDMNKTKRKKKLLPLLQVNESLPYIDLDTHQEYHCVPLIIVKETAKSYLARWETRNKSREVYIPKSAIQRIESNKYKDVSFKIGNAQVSLTKYQGVFVREWYIEFTRSTERSRDDQYLFFDEWVPAVNKAMSMYHQYRMTEQIRTALRLIHSKVFNIDNIELQKDDSYLIRAKSRKYVARELSSGITIKLDDFMTLNINNKNAEVTLSMHNVNLNCADVVIAGMFGSFSLKKLNSRFTAWLNSHDWHYERASGRQYKQGAYSRRGIDEYKRVYKYFNVESEYDKILVNYKTH